MTTLKDIKKESTLVANDKIRAERVQLITQDGENKGVVPRLSALRAAQDAGLDLVLIAERGKDDVPVVKIMDLGKALYEKKKKLAEAKKHQKTVQIKEIKMRPKIGEHDYLTKIKQVVQFLHEGKRVKVTLSFKGRENVQRDERGTEFFQKIEGSFTDLGAEHVAFEQDTRMGQLWSRIYYIKKP